MSQAKTKRKKVSKKTKKAWRKHVDTKDVDKFLENSRLTERLGSFASRKDSELFVVSTKPQIISKGERRKLLKSTEPRCLSILKSRSAVPDPISKRNRVKTKEERMNKLVLKKEAIRKSKGILKLKEKLKIKNKMLAEEKRSIKSNKDEFNSNVWKDTILKDINTDWMSSGTVKHVLTHYGMKKKRIPSSLHTKPSMLSSVEVPHPGTSYNPSFEDHQQLLYEVAQNEMKLMKEEKHLERVTTKMFKKVTHNEKENNLMEEMLEGLNSQNSGEIDEDVDEDPTVKSVNPPAQNLKKTRVQRRKQKEQKALAHRIQHEKVEKKKLSDIYKLKQLGKQLVTKEKKENILREKRLKKKALKAGETKTLNRVKFEPMEQDFKLTKELTGNLRNSEPTGNLLKDRFKSLQQRNIVAPSKIKLKRHKAKVKRFIKPDHKIDEHKVK